MITLLLSDIIAKPPEQRTSQNGNPDVTATRHPQEGEDALFASVTVFGVLYPVLAGLVKDDSIRWSALAR